MRKKTIFLTAGVILATTILVVNKGQEEEVQYSSVMRARDQIISAAINVEDVTEEYKEREQKTKECIADFLNRECSEIAFTNYCMLEMDGMTIEANIENVDYTFLLNIKGELLSVSRSDGKKLKS